jgi:hypothetical protein
VQGALLDARDWLKRADCFVVTWSGWHTCPVTIWLAAAPPGIAGEPRSNEGDECWIFW